MIFGTVKTLARVFCFSLIVCSIAVAECAVDVVTVKVRVEHSPRNAKVRVQLVYANGQVEDCAEATIDGSTFKIPVDFLTQSRRPLLVGTFREKCDRKPKTVVVALWDGDQEDNRVSLNFPKGLRDDRFKRLCRAV
jgi:hypothetical protein